MKLYLAGLSTGLYMDMEDLFADVKYVLESFYAVRKGSDFCKYINVFDDFILDSGAFTFMQGKEKVDWREYIDKYVDFINKYDIDRFFELDIDAVEGIEKVESLRSRLEEGTGKRCIPVWHKNRGTDYWKRMCKKYDYVAIGGMATDDSRKYRNWLVSKFPWFIKEAHKRGAKVHGLGYTPSNLKNCLFDSVDSTSWLGHRWGNLYRFTGNDIKKVSRRKGKLKNYKKSARHNLLEWIKLQKFLDKK